MTSAAALAPNLSFSISFLSSTSKLSCPIFVLPARINGRRLKICAQAAISRDRGGAFDPELRSVLELATDSELYELETILFGPSYFSPLLKSITSRAEVDRAMIGVDLQEREEFIAALESRFLFLAADARSTLRGWRPSYRDVLLEVRKKLNIPCSSKLSTEDLEVEIFLHLLQDNSSEESGTFLGLLDLCTASNVQGGLELGFSQWKAQVLAALKVGAGEFRSMILKGGGIFTLAKIYHLLTRKLSGKVLLEAANYQIKKELMKKGGQLAVINLESRAALLTAKQGFLGAASRYVGFRSLMTLLGPVYLLHLISFYNLNFLKLYIILMTCFPGFGEPFWQILSFKCLELIMLESCEQFMLLPRFESPVHIGYHLMFLKSSMGCPFLYLMVRDSVGL